MLHTELIIFFIFLILITEPQNPISVQVSRRALGIDDMEVPVHYASLCRQEQREDGAVLVNTHALTHCGNMFARIRACGVSISPSSSAVSGPCSKWEQDPFNPLLQDAAWILPPMR